MTIDLILQLIDLIIKIIKAWQAGQPKSATAPGVSTTDAVAHLQQAKAALKKSR
jgi:hypothetical protein